MISQHILAINRGGHGCPSGILIISQNSILGLKSRHIYSNGKEKDSCQTVSGRLALRLSV